MLEGGGKARTVIADASGMTFAPRFSPDGGAPSTRVPSAPGSDLFVGDIGGRSETS